MSEELADLISGLEAELLQPRNRKSADKLSELIAEEFIEIGESGSRYTKKEVIGLLPRQAPARYAISDFQANEIAPDLVLATYTAAKTVEETGSTTHSRRSSLWRRREGRWQVVFHQGTPVHKQPMSDSTADSTEEALSRSTLTRTG